MVMRDDHVYIASGWEGLNIIDASSPETMELVGAWGAETYVRNVAFSGNFAFVAGSSDGLHAVDISNPSMPSTISILDLYSSVRDVAIGSGDVVLVTSDGAAEAIAPTGEHFGYDRVIEYLEKCDGRSAAAIVEGLVDSVTSFAGDAPLHDDITVLAMVADE